MVLYLKGVREDTPLVLYILVINIYELGIYV